MIREGSRVALVGKDVRSLIDMISVPDVFWFERRESPRLTIWLLVTATSARVPQATAMIDSSKAFGHVYGMEDVVMDDEGVLRLTYNGQATCPNGGPFVMANPFGFEYPLHGLEGSKNPAWRDMAWKYNPTFEKQDGIQILFYTAPRVYADYTRVSLDGCLDMLSHPANDALTIRETWPNLVQIGDLRRREATVLFMILHGDQYWIGVRDRTVDPPDLSLTHYYESDTPEKYETGLGSIVLDVVGDQCLRQFFDPTLLQIPLDGSSLEDYDRSYHV